jgi:hypothetical protein
MHFFLTVTIGRNPTAPPPELQTAMTALVDEETRAGRIVWSGAFAPSEQSSRVALFDGKVETNARNGAAVAIDGFAVLEAPSIEAALETASRMMELHRQHVANWDIECAVRPIVTQCLP